MDVGNIHRSPIWTTRRRPRRWSVLWRERRGQSGPNQPRPARNLSDECGAEQCSRGERMIRVGCDRVGVVVRGEARPGDRA